MEIRWITAFVDRREHRFEETAAFWEKATDSTLSPWRGERGEFATLMPSDGSDAHLRVQRTQSETSGSHIDLHVSDVPAGIEECLHLGASMVSERETYAVLATPGGMVFCVVPHRGETTRQRPVGGAGRSMSLLDQVCIDVDPDTFDDEVRFWSTVTGWSPLAARAPEFVPLERPPSMPLRVMLQARDTSVGTTGCHLDIACEDRSSAIEQHELLGAVAGPTYRYWTVMTDPSGSEYCLTSREPESGLLPREG